MNFPAEESAASGSTDSFLAPPSDSQPSYSLVERTFLFVDIVGSVAMMEKEGTNKTAEKIVAFRQLVMDVAGKRGVRVAKWLGDGALIVSTCPDYAFAAAGELLWRARGLNIPITGGMATGESMILSGDDYLSASANLAARLSDVSSPSRIYAHAYKAFYPSWVQVEKLEKDFNLKGFQTGIPVLAVKGVSEEIFKEIEPSDIRGMYPIAR